MNVYIIVGEKNTRKSTIARCLCGCSYSHDLWRDIEDSNGNQFELFVERNSSLQEETGILPQDFVNKINKGIPHNGNTVVPTDILVLLRVQKVSDGGSNFPDAQTYINHFESQPNWTTKALILLDQPASQTTPFPSSNQKPIVIMEPHIKTDPINKTAADIRSKLGWM